MRATGYIYGLLPKEGERSELTVKEFFVSNKRFDEYLGLVTEPDDKKRFTSKIHEAAELLTLVLCLTTATFY